MKLLAFLLVTILTLSPSLAQINCFVYHRFGEARYPSTNISAEIFEQQLAWLKQNQYEVISLSKAVELIKSGNIEGKKAVITIDDAYTSFFTNGLPLLKKYGYPSTLFVNTENIGQKGYFTWNELLQASEQGVEIGNHTHSHAYFLDMPESDRARVFKEDVQKAQALLKEKLSIQPKLFAYPFGEYDQAMKAVVKELGFEAAAAQNSGVMSSHADLYALPRFPMGGAYATLSGFKEKLRMHALSVKVIDGNDQLFTQNPPVLSLRIEQADLQWSTLSCYIGGKKQEAIKREGNLVSVQSTYPTKSRRTLYTLTAQAKDGKWYWFSHVWVNPSVKE